MVLSERPPDIPLPTMGAKPGELGQRNWWDDIDLLNRVQRVHSLTAQKLSAEKIGRILKVTARTVHEDRSRYLELKREDIRRDVQDHIDDLGRVIEEAYAAFHAITASSTFGIKRSDYLNIIRQAKMDIAKLDGSLNAEQQIQIGIQVNMGPAPNELYAQGKLADADYESHLRVLALQSGAEIIEGEVLSPVAEESALGPVVSASPPDAGGKTLARPQRRGTSPPPTPEAVAPAAASPSDDPLLADFVPDPPRDDEEDEE